LFDVDLQASAFTNAVPLRRLGLSVGRPTDAPALYVQSADLEVTVLPQEYTVLDNRQGTIRVRYRSPGFASELVYDRSGLVIDYPAIARRQL
jgi:hypothetical protein